MQRVPPRKVFQGASRTLAVNATVQPEELARFLEANGYGRASTVMHERECVARRDPHGSAPLALANPMLGFQRVLQTLDTGPGKMVPHPIIFLLPWVRNGTPAGVLT